MIKISNIAIEKIISILDKENSSIIRFGLKGTGCAGFQYFLLVESTQKLDDFEFILNETKKLVIDVDSFAYLSDAEIDYKKDLLSESFVFTSPNVQSKCGCGKSVNFD